MSAQSDRFVHDRLPPRAAWPQFSYPTGSPAGDEVLNLVAALLDKALSQPWADAPLFRSATQTLSYRQAQALVNQRAHYLIHVLGLVPGNRVLIRGTNSIGFALCWLAVVKAGLIAVSTMPMLRAKELCEVIHKSQPVLALCESHLADELTMAQQQSPGLSSVVLFGDVQSTDGLEMLSETLPTVFEACPTTGDDIAMLAFTSGTTGSPKAACHSHLDVWSACQAWPLSVLKASSSDVVLGTPPLAFTFGLGGLLLFPMVAGASVYFPNGPLNPEAMLLAMQDAGCTICYTAPTFYRQMAPLMAAISVSNLRVCVSAGEALPNTTRQLWKQACGIELLDGIGATEMFHIFISSPPDRVRAGSLGQVVPGYEACVLDAHGAPVPHGQVGRLAVRGPTGCKYLDDARQATYVQNGWNFPGDTVFQDADGYFHYQSRADDMIISAGYNIAGPEVEDALLMHPAVLECAVVGKPDTERGMVVQAFCVLRPGFAANEAIVKRLQEHVKSSLAPYKYPRDVVFLEALPRTPTGKLQRFKLRQLPLI
jgi:2-aminobenzoate-CoA ligase